MIRSKKEIYICVCVCVLTLGVRLLPIFFQLLKQLRCFALNIISRWNRCSPHISYIECTHTYREYVKHLNVMLLTIFHRFKDLPHIQCKRGHKYLYFARWYFGWVFFFLFFVFVYLYRPKQAYYPASRVVSKWLNRQYFHNTLMPFQHRTGHSFRDRVTKIWKLNTSEWN